MRLINMSALVRIAKPLKKTVIGIGVALCVTPFFVSAQSNDSSRTLLELQSLRQEIAELRDMVERQQYELRKLKNPPRTEGRRPLPSAAPSDSPASGDNNTSEYLPAGESSGQTGYSADQTYSNDSSQTDGSYSQQADGSYSQRADGSYSQQADGSSPQGSEASQVGVPNEGWVTNDAASAPTQSTAAGNRDAYARPFENAGNGAPVSESPINTPPIQTDGYPPVVDRSIGNASVGNAEEQAAVSASEQANTTQGADPYEYTSPSAVSNRPQALPNDSQVPSDIRPYNDNAGVVAVPSGVDGQVNSQVSGAVNNQANNQARTAEDLLPANKNVTNPSASGNGAASGNAIDATELAEQEYYQQGFSLLKKSEHDEAVSVFKQQIASYPQGEYADDAYYWVAESMYVNRKLDESKASFRAIIDGYKQSPRLPDALLKTAYIEQEQGNEIEARILLQEIMQFHPRSNAAISAKNRLAELK